MSKMTDQQLMDEFFATHTYNEHSDWTKEPLTAVDPDEEPVRRPSKGVKAMSVTLNSVGAAHMRSLIAAGKVDKTSSWSFSAEDGNAMMGANGEMGDYPMWHLGLHTDAAPKTKERYGYPFGKNGKVYRSAVIAIKQRAAQQGASGIEAAASAALEKIDAKKSLPVVKL